MPKLPFALAAFAIATLFEIGPSHAYEAPWCAVYEIGPGAVAERCEFTTFEACRQEITGGNRGFCNNNPRFAGNQEFAPHRKVSRKRHRH